ncbi:phospholipase A1 PLIP2, chloroplastic-like [Henckelia pumila]|uniref:phospholipase A1 PLIP2, chloroplastic-like n=1 Tax=Henckelia pumila TaxID=405737 RepID=UPI003C6DEADB
MDVLCLKAGIHAVATAPNGEHRLSSMPLEKPSFSAPPRRNPGWVFTFRHPLRSLWPDRKHRYEPAIAVDDAVSVDENEEIDEAGTEEQDENWVLKILRVKSLFREEDKYDDLVYDIGRKMEKDNESRHEFREKCGEETDDECDLCAVDDDEKIEFDRESFTKLLRKVSLAEARLYAKMSYLGSLAYSIPQIKPENLLNNIGLRFLTSSIEKKEQALEAEKERVPSEDQQEQVTAADETRDAHGNEIEQAEGGEAMLNGNLRRVSAAYHIAASAALYLHSHTRSLLRFNSSKSMSSEKLAEEMSAGTVGLDAINQDMASLIATTDSVTAVVAAKEEVKQAVADDLNSTRSSPCEWFMCDDDQSATRYFVIQGSESLASWQANLLFEPVQFEGLDVLVHRGIYEAAKGIYEQMLPEIRAHLESRGDRAKFRFTGHSLGGSLSLLVNLMLLIRGEAPRSSLLPVITFGTPSIMCGGDRLLRNLGLPRNHVRSITMHRDIVPRAFSCHYPNHVAEFLKAVNGKFRNHPCLNKQKLLYAPMGEFFILQPDEKFSPSHDLLPSGSGLYVFTDVSKADVSKAEKQILAAQSVFLNSPHPLEILSDRSAYGSEGTIQRDHDMNSYLKSIRQFIRQELIRMRKAKREHRPKFWWPVVVRHGINPGIIISRSVNLVGQVQFNISGIVQSSTESLKRFGTLMRSKHMHMLVVLLLPTTQR